MEMALGGGTGGEGEGGLGCQAYVCWHCRQGWVFLPLNIHCLTSRVWSEEFTLGVAAAAEVGGTQRRRVDMGTVGSKEGMALGELEPDLDPMGRETPQRKWVFLVSRDTSFPTPQPPLRTVSGQSLPPLALSALGVVRSGLQAVSQNLCSCGT